MWLEHQLVPFLTSSIPLFGVTFHTLHWTPTQYFFPTTRGWTSIRMVISSSNFITTVRTPLTAILPSATPLTKSLTLLRLVSRVFNQKEFMIRPGCCKTTRAVLPIQPTQSNGVLLRTRAWSRTTITWLIAQTTSFPAMKTPTGFQATAVINDAKGIHMFKFL